VVLLEAAPESNSQLQDQYSNRVAALNPASVSILDELGAWDEVKQARAQPVHRMQVWDS